MRQNNKLPRRSFLKQAAGVLGAATQLGNWPAAATVKPHHDDGAGHEGREWAPEQTSVTYPRSFRGQQLQMISFPLGRVAAGSLGLGAVDNCATARLGDIQSSNQGSSPAYAFPAIWVNQAMRRR
jgi:non-lysosomal glucosylceramidase